MTTNYTTQNDLLLVNLLTFYNVHDCDGIYNPNNNLDKMLKIITGETKISLRIIDWFTTNYAKKYFIIYNIEGSNDNIPRRFKVYNEYKLKLDSYGKNRFDPFCRWDRINIPHTNGKFIETTIGQLNFFKWALENQLIDYINHYYNDIERDMNARNSTSKRKETIADNNKTRKKREELSVSASKSIKKEKVEIVVRFN
jgi:hypothetical protein